MKASIVDLRYRMKSVLAALDRGEPVTVLHRGRPRARLVPITEKKKRRSLTEHPAFGMWKDREDMADVAKYVRELRKPRLIFDTDVLIAFTRGDSDAARLIRADPERAISIVTLMDLVQGARSASEAMTIRSFLREHDLDVIPIDEAISYLAAGFIDAYSHSAGLRLPDALVAATAHHWTGVGHR